MPTIPLESRLELSTLAEMDIYLTEIGANPLNKSDLVWRIVEMFHTLLVEQGYIKEKMDAESALLHMQQKYGRITRKGRGEMKTMLSITKDIMQKDGLNPAYASAPRGKSTEVDIQTLYNNTKIALIAMGETVPSFEEFEQRLKGVK